MNREAERKRLVELLQTAPLADITLGEYFNKPYIENCIVPHLLDNGIVVPPVKVGQIVYFVERNSGKPIGTIDEIEIVLIGKTESGFCARGNLGENTVDIKPPFEIDNYTFFTSREDAVKALGGDGE